MDPQIFKYIYVHASTKIKCMYFNMRTFYLFSAFDRNGNPVEKFDSQHEFEDDAMVRKELLRALPSTKSHDHSEL